MLFLTKSESALSPNLAAKELTITCYAANGMSCLSGASAKSSNAGVTLTVTLILF
jgi:hypothetical protein